MDVTQVFWWIPLHKHIPFIFERKGGIGHERTATCRHPRRGYRRHQSSAETGQPAGRCADHRSQQLPGLPAAPLSGSDIDALDG